MAKRKFKCTVTRVDEYEIELDEECINDIFFKEFSSYMYPIECMEDVAEDIARLRARNGEDFYEGYGRPYVNGQKPFCMEESSLVPEININIIDEDSDIDVEVEEVS